MLLGPSVAVRDDHHRHCCSDGAVSVCVSWELSADEQLLSASSVCLIPAAGGIQAEHSLLMSVTMKGPRGPSDGDVNT